MINQEFMFDYFLNITNIFIGHLVWGVAISLILWYFHTLYKRRHLKLWSLSWLSFSLYLVFAFTTLYFANVEGVPSFLQLLFSFLFMLASLLQVIWLLGGAYNLIQKKSLSTRFEFISYGVAILLSVTISQLYLFFDDYSTLYSILIPFGIKSLLVGLSFIMAGIIIMRVGRKDKTVGKKLLWVTFVIYGLENLHYLRLVFDMFLEPDNILEFNYVYGMVDFLLLSLIGIGMIIWLLEDERTTLEKTNRELDSFLYSTSHDLRAPVASLLGLINIAKHDIKEEQGVKYIRMMEERVKKLDHIFSDILNYSRNIKTEINPKTFRLGDIVDDVISDLKFNEGADSIRLDFDEQIHHILRTDYYQLKVVLSNLISNAVKYHDYLKSDQYIAVRFDKIDRDVQITVEDNGLGIPQESQHKVFDMFYRATSEAEGSGLGLFIVKQALEKINAHIILKSELGQGSEFRVIIHNASVKSLSPSKNALA